MIPVLFSLFSGKVLIFMLNFFCISPLISLEYEYLENPVHGFFFIMISAKGIQVMSFEFLFWFWHIEYWNEMGLDGEIDIGDSYTRPT